MFQNVAKMLSISKMDPNRARHREGTEGREGRERREGTEGAWECPERPEVSLAAQLFAAVQPQEADTNLKRRRRPKHFSQKAARQPKEDEKIPKRRRRHFSQNKACEAPDSEKKKAFGSVYPIQSHIHPHKHTQNTRKTLMTP